MGEIRNRKGGSRKRNGWRECGDPHSGKKSEILLTLRGKSEGVGRRVGNEGTNRLLTRPQFPSHRLLLRPSVPRGAASGAVKGVRDSRPHDDPALGLQRLSRSEDRQAARSWCRFADWAEVFGRGDEVQSA